MTKYLSLLIVSSILLTQSSMAAEKQSPTDAFRGETQFQMLTCGLKVKISIQEAQLGKETTDNDPAKCVKDGKAKVKKLFPIALKSVSKSSAAGKLIKEYYAVWLTAFDAVLPRPGDLTIDYERRQAANEAKYDEAWNRLEIEAGI